MVGSSSIRTSPTLTFCPSRTWMARAIPVSKGCTTLGRPLGMILPGAEATIAIRPTEAQANARQKTPAIVTAMPRPNGEGGVSMISSAAGKNASSSLAWRRWSRGNAMTFSVDFMDPCLQAKQRGVAPACPYQFVMGAVFDQPTPIHGQDAVRAPHGRQPMGDV